ncbi:MAG: transcriptional regulator NrdR [Chlamydiota bacterium]
MKCPFCSHEESKVTDSRSVCETNAIRRRRECLSCSRRFTTFETVDILLQVRKRDGSFEDFQVEKLIKGVDAASRHTRISHDQVRDLGSSIVTELMEKQMREIPATALGEMVMERLRRLDTVTYIRFACVYRRFKDVDEIMNAIHTAAPEEEAGMKP